MKNFLKQFLDESDYQFIKRKHVNQKIRYGVYQPPSLKELISLRHLLISLGIIREDNCEDLLGLTKTECLMLLKRLQKIEASNTD